jgi:hypothetical protein
MSGQTKNAQLIDEFHVQVYSNGRINWDNLDRIVPILTAHRHYMMGLVERKTAGTRPVASGVS